MVWLPDGENNWKMCLFVLTEFANMADSQTPHGQGRRQGFRPGWAKFGAKRRKNFFRLPTLVFSLPTLPYVTVAHPAHRTQADLREKGKKPCWPLIKRALPFAFPSLPSPPSDLALQLGLVIHTPGL